MEFDVGSELSRILQAYVDAGSKRTINSIARKTSLSTSTVDRIYKNECPNPNLETVLAITQLVDDKEACLELIKKKWPNQYSFLEQAMRQNSFQIKDGEFSALLRDVENWIIVTLAARRNGGTSREEISEILPKTGSHKLLLLLDTGAVHEINNRIRCSDFMVPEVESCLNQIANMTVIFNRDNLGTGGVGRICNWSEGLSDSGLKAVISAYDEFLSKLETIRSAEEMLGSHPVFLGLIIDEITKGIQK